jgi:hypothetical protein
MVCLVALSVGARRRVAAQKVGAPGRGGIAARLPGR